MNSLALIGPLQKETDRNIFAQMSCHCYNNKLTNFNKFSFLTIEKYLQIFIKRIKIVWI